MAQGDTTITITGNLTREPELRFTPSSVPVCKFAVAVTPRVFDKASQQWKDGATSFYEVIAWRALGENCATSLKKGMAVVVTGRLDIRPWESGDRKGIAVEVTADAIGPNLARATAAVTKTSGNSGQPPREDPFESASAERPTAGATAQSQRATQPVDDEPPW